MTLHQPIEVERSIARCRVVLSIAAFITVFIDPTRPTLTRWMPLRGGPFMLDPFALGVMLSHLAYSGASYLVVARRLAAPTRIAVATTWADVLFGVSIALVTEGANSPSFVFFAFAVLVAGFRGGLRPTLVVTVASVALYLSLVLVSNPEGLSVYVMRPAYLAIMGYLVGYLGEQRLALEGRLRTLEAANQRERIARSLHDEYVQALAAVNVRVEICRELLRQGRHEEARGELTELQVGVNREHDELRSYIRSLVDLEAGLARRTVERRTRFAVHARFDGSLVLIEHALQIMLEGARNVGVHAAAESAVIRVDTSAEKIVITIDDDGIGFPAGAAPPWSIASRAAELGGEIRVGPGGQPGGHVEIELPEC